MTINNYLLNFSWKNLTDNQLMNTVALGSVALALLLMGGVLLVQQNVSLLIRRMQADAPVVVFLEDNVLEDERREIQAKLIARPEISGVSYRSADEALKQFRKMMGAEENLIDGLTRNPFPASLHLELKPGILGEIEDLAAEIGGWSGVESVDYGQQILERLQGLGRVVQVVMGMVGLIICLVAVFVIFNTIQLSVMSHATEIEILKLVGATRWFIGAPFIVGGVVHGFLGSLLSLGLLWVLFWITWVRFAALPFLTAQFYFLTNWRIGMVVFLGILLGVSGSATAIYRTVKKM